jgi:tRNA A-37 threonylcarbamoyl transferase component Bud32
MLKQQCINYLDKNINGVIKIVDKQMTYWLKISGENKSNFIRKVSSLMGKLNLLSFFQSKATMDSFSRFEHEKFMLHHLASIGFQVPKIELEGPGYFVTQDQGCPMSQIEDARVTDDMLEQLFSLFAKLHNSDIAHGRPALRDILVNEIDQLSLIDFEESIMHANSKLKARDIYLLLMDLCRIEGITLEQKRHALIHWRQQVPRENWENLLQMHRVIRKFGYIGKCVLLFKKRNKLSKQILNTINLLDTFN